MLDVGVIGIEKKSKESLIYIRNINAAELEKDNLFLLKE